MTKKIKKVYKRNSMNDVYYISEFNGGDSLIRFGGDLMTLLLTINSFENSSCESFLTFTQDIEEFIHSSFSVPRMEHISECILDNSNV